MPTRLCRRRKRYGMQPSRRQVSEWLSGFSVCKINCFFIFSSFFLPGPSVLSARPTAEEREETDPFRKLLRHGHRRRGPGRSALCTSPTPHGGLCGPSSRRDSSAARSCQRRASQPEQPWRHTDARFYGDLLSLGKQHRSSLLPWLLDGSGSEAACPFSGAVGGLIPGAT